MQNKTLTFSKRSDIMAKKNMFDEMFPTRSKPITTSSDIKSLSVGNEKKIIEMLEKLNQQGRGHIALWLRLDLEEKTRLYDEYGADRVVIDEDYDGNYEVYYSNPEGEHLDDVKGSPFSTREEAARNARQIADEYKLGLVDLL
tara:strand:+ start:337 stop:765 length:429 start_codon:yes stop_codon:yes gene_type:complete